MIVHSKPKVTASIFVLVDMIIPSIHLNVVIIPRSYCALKLRVTLFIRLNKLLRSV